MLAALLYVAAGSTENNSDCVSFLSTLWQSPNASSSYIIPAIVQLNTSEGQTSRILNDTTHYWEIVDSVAETTGTWTQIDRDVFLDTQYSNSNIPPYQAGCAITFFLPDSKQYKHSADGNCSSVIGSECVNSIETNINSLAESTAGSKEMSLDEACASLARSLSTLPRSCPKAPGFSLRSWAGKRSLHFLKDVKIAY